jgi:hypothetical protein
VGLEIRSPAGIAQQEQRNQGHTGLHWNNAITPSAAQDSASHGVSN